MPAELNEYAAKRIHLEQNVRKYDEYWAGFLYGILSSGKIRHMEGEALRSVSEDFLNRFDDADAMDLLDDMDAWPDSLDEIAKSVQGIVDYRTGGIEDILRRGSIPRCFFFGYMKGIACDDHITVEELQGLIELGVRDPELAERDPRIREVINVAQLAIHDNVISDDENDDICDYISRIVGDSYASTGIGLPDDRPVLDGTVRNLEEVEFQERSFVLTGSFSVPRKVLVVAVERRGGSFLSNVSGQTDYLVMADAGSEHYATPNAGTKILAAIQARERHGRLRFVPEATLKPILMG